MASNTATGPMTWLNLSALFGAGALLGWWLPAPWIDWQPALASAQPWRWWSAAFVHWSALHLAANLAGLAVVALLGLVARLPARAAWAWFAAWPLTQLGLLAQPTLAHYGGLSGVLHAGVAVAALALVWRGRGSRRRIGAAIAFGLGVKIVAEAPWQGALRHSAGWDIAIAPLAHLSGALSGALCMALILLASARRRRRDRRHR